MVISAKAGTKTRPSARAKTRTLSPAIDRLCVIGHPSHLGGADTELHHQMLCWQAMGIEVHLCHTAELDGNLRAMKLESQGVVYHAPRDWASLEGLHCISFCNGEFLKNLFEIRPHARTTTFVNCMTWNFDAEIEAQRQGLIDFHLYQTQHALARVGPALARAGKFRPLCFRPYFHAEDFPFHTNRPNDKFRFGRISRGDADKFGSRQLWIYETMTAPVLKEGLIVGWDDRAEAKFQRRPDDYVHVLGEGGLSQREFYEFCEAIIMTTDTFENLPRVGFEAMASGSLLVVDHRGGWTLQVEDGRTGWLCHDDREFIYKASRAAFEAEERAQMCQSARKKLEAEWGLEPAMASWNEFFKACVRLR